MPTSGSSNQNQTGANVIKNPQSNQLPQVKGSKMNERDFTNDILATEKYLTDNLNIFTREASNQSLHGDTFRILQETHNAARDLYDLMFQKGWYKLTAAPEQEIQQSVQQFQNYQSQFPY